MIRRDYVANNGWETFLSYEDPEQDILIGLLRLRKCSPDTFRGELKSGCSIVRELHVYGSVVPVHARDPTKFQHQVSLYLYTFEIIVSDWLKYENNLLSPVIEIIVSEWLKYENNPVITGPFEWKLRKEKVFI